MKIVSSKPKRFSLFFPREKDKEKESGLDVKEKEDGKGKALEKQRDKKWGQRERMRVWSIRDQVSMSPSPILVCPARARIYISFFSSTAEPIKYLVREM